MYKLVETYIKNFNNKQCKISRKEVKCGFDVLKHFKLKFNSLNVTKFGG